MEVLTREQGKMLEKACNNIDYEKEYLKQIDLNQEMQVDYQCRMEEMRKMYEVELAKEKEKNLQLVQELAVYEQKWSVIELIFGKR